MTMRGFASLPLGILRRQGKVELAVTVETASAVIGVGIVPCVGAILGAGLWSLPFGLAAHALIRLGSCLTYWPAMRFDRSIPREARGMAGLAGGSGLASAMNYLAQNVDTFVVGTLLGAPALGVYSRGYGLATIPLRLYDSVHTMIFFPEMARAASDGDLRDTTQTLSIAALTIGTVMAAAVSGASTEIVHVVLGPNWNEAAIVLQLLAMALPARLMLRVLEGAAIVSAQVYGPSLRYAGLAVLTLALLLGLAGQGLAAVALGVSGATWIMAFVSLFLVCRALDFPAMLIARCGLAAFLVSGFASWAGGQIPVADGDLIITALVGIGKGVAAALLAILGITLLIGGASRRLIRSRIQRHLS